MIQYAWWQSEYDGRCHAFPVADTGNVRARFREAACEHCVPVNRLNRTQAGMPCVACLIEVGADITENQ